MSAKVRPQTSGRLRPGTNLFVPYAPNVGSAEEVSAMRAKITTLETVNEELMRAKSEFAFLTPFEFAQRTNMTQSGNFNEVTVERLRRLEETLMRYVKQLAEARAEISHLGNLPHIEPSLVEKLKQENNELREEIDRCVKKMARVDKDRESTGQALAAARSELQRIVAENERIEKEKAEKGKKKAEEGKLQIAKAVKDAEKLNGELRTAKEALIREMTKTEELRIKFEAEKERNKRNKENDGSRSKEHAVRIEELERKLADSELAVANMNKHMDAMVDSRAAVNRELSACKDQLEQQRALLAAAQMEHESQLNIARQEQEALRREIQGLQAHSDSHAHAKRSADDEANMLRDALAAANQEVAQLKIAMERIEENNRALSAEIRMEGANSRKNLDSLVTDLQKREHALKTIELQRDADKRALDEATHALNAERTKHAQQLKAKDDEVAKIKEANVRIHDELQSTRRELEVMLAGAGIDPREFAAIKQELAFMTKREADLRVRVVELEDILEETQRELREARDDSPPQQQQQQQQQQYFSSSSSSSMQRGASSSSLVSGPSRPMSRK